MNKHVSWTRFDWSYPFGSEMDPFDKEGLTHLVEHLLLKTPLSDMNLMTLCELHSCRIGAATSYSYLRMFVEGNLEDLVKLAEKIVLWLRSAASGFELEDSILEEEKEVVRNEILYKSDHLSKTEKTVGNVGQPRAAIHPILGSKESLSRIDKEDVRKQLASLLSTQPEVTVVYLLDEDRQRLNDSMQALASGKAIHWGKKTSENMDPQFGEVQEWGEGVWAKIELLSGKHSAALSLRPGPVLRQNLRNMSRILLSELKLHCQAEIMVSCELGALSLYMTGDESCLRKAIDYTADFSRRVESQTAKRRIESEDRRVGLKGICEFMLHRQAIPAIHSNDFSAANEKRSYTPEYPAKLQIAVVATFDPNDCIPFSYQQDKERVESIETKEPRLPVLSSNEYVEIWEGPDLFSPDKYVSHTLWSIVSGIDGEMYRSFTGGHAKLYSHTFFPRELFDFGYRVLYAHCPDKSARTRIGADFRNLLYKLSDEVDDRMLQTAWYKIQIGRERARRTLPANLIYLSVRLLVKPGQEAFVRYDETFDMPDSKTVKRHIREWLCGSSWIAETEEDSVC